MVDAETIANCGFDLQVNKIRRFQVRSDDIFIVTYPKSGTTWMKELVPLVINGGDIDSIKDTPPDARVPHLEFTVSDDPLLKHLQATLGVNEDFDLNKMVSPRTIVSHLEAKYLPQQIEEKKCKVIYVSRNPKDVAVSCFHFVQAVTSSRSSPGYESFSAFLLDFISAKNDAQCVIYGGSLWKDHVLHWWSRRHDSNVLFMFYEDMKQDLIGNIRKVAEFLEVKLDDNVVDKIADHCSFDSMKKNPMALKSDYCSQRLKVNPTQDSPFVRKGKVGGWKNYFTVADNELFDSLYKVWIKDSDLKMQFDLP
ncbi:sulfotransferase 1E1-like [Saccoglossus kowalevskii]|uniref:Estrogen sulfotransferase-like n=1 Tax=Saccoglossus kowalevskii TaxID=10224 RepID=A0ABM0MCW5_SACKO|nr:PREDICTED: estrogen sulfotransferase-like [Saccoglossus kowalevskii]